MKIFSKNHEKSLDNSLFFYRMRRVAYKYFRREPRKIMMYVFVYGTLKRGFRNNHYLSSGEFVREAMTAPKYRLYAFPGKGGFPCLVEDMKNGVKVKGEIWLIPEESMNRIDLLEGVHIGLYVKKSINLEGFDKAVISYFWNSKIDEDQIDCGESW